MIAGIKRKRDKNTLAVIHAPEGYVATGICPSPRRRVRSELEALSAGSFSIVPDEIVRLVASYIGPTRDLINLQTTNNFFGTLLVACWEAFSKDAFEGFQLTSGYSGYSQSASSHLRYFQTKRYISSFRSCGVSQFSPRIDVTNSDDEIVYFNLRFVPSVQPVYLEISVDENCDNFSFSLVDFDGTGRSSITFSPETGVVIKEKQIKELPGKVEGLFSFPLQPTATSTMGPDRFVGQVGMCVTQGKLAFLRRLKGNHAWETTNFCADVSWLSAGIFTPCIAFRDKGRYRVSISKVGRESPISCTDNLSLLGESSDAWHTLDWDQAEVDRR